MSFWTWKAKSQKVNAVMNRRSIRQIQKLHWIILDRIGFIRPNTLLIFSRQANIRSLFSTGRTKAIGIHPPLLDQRCLAYYSLLHAIQNLERFQVRSPKEEKKSRLICTWKQRRPLTFYELNNRLLFTAINYECGNKDIKCPSHSILCLFLSLPSESGRW